MLITLQSPVIRDTSTRTLEVMSVTDKPGQKVCTAEVSIENVGTQTYLLWQDDSYDVAGQWTDSDVAARVEAIFSGS